MLNVFHLSFVPALISLVLALVALGSVSPVLALVSLVLVLVSLDILDMPWAWPWGLFGGASA